MSYTRCLELMARLYGFANCIELKRAASAQPLSAFDDEAADDVLEIRFQHQECVMVEASFADLAGTVLDEVNPTSLRNGPAAEFDEVGAVNTKLGNDDV